MGNLYQNKKTLLNKTKDGTAQYFYETFVSCMRLIYPNKKLANDVNLSEKKYRTLLFVTNMQSFRL